MTKLKNGCIFLARSIQDNEIWMKPSDWLKVWLYILQNVSYNGNSLLEKGEGLFKCQDIAAACHVKVGAVRRLVQWCKQTTRITTRKTTRGIFIKVLNYAVYQSLDSYKSNTESNTESKIETKQKQNRSNSIGKGSKEVSIKYMSKSDFEKFWQEYPRRVSRSKAEQKFLKLPIGLLPEIMKALALQKQTASWAKDNGAFVPHPTTWLNGRRWEDEINTSDKPRRAPLQLTAKDLEDF